MILHSGHYDRYAYLMEKAVAGANDWRKSDVEYMSALYILSADTDLSMLAIYYVDAHGIDFKKIVSACKRHDLTETQMTVVKTAWNLFNRDGGKETSPKDLAQCDYDTLDILAKALYIRKGGRRLNPGEDGCIALATEREEKAREIARACQTIVGGTGI